MPRIEVNDVSLYYELYGDGEPLVLIHGLQGDASNFRRLAPALGRDFRVLLFDQRGSGYSDKPDMEYPTALLADDTVALMRALGFDAAHLLGTSMGGQVAQQFALRHPDVLRRLILACTTSGGADAVPVDMAMLAAAYTLEDLTAEERAVRLARSSFTPDWLAGHPEIIDELAAARRQRPLDLDALARRNRAFEHHDTFADLGRIRAPTLVLTGTPDAIIPDANSAILAERIPDARLRVLDPAGHLFWIEREADTLAAVREFLDA